METINPSDVGGTLEFLTTTAIHLATDFFAFLVIGGVIAGFALYAGRDRFAPLIAALYASIPLFMFFPYDVSAYGGVIVQLALWVFIVLLALVAFSGLSSFVAGGSIGLIKLLILSATTAGFLIAVGIHILPVEQVYTFSAPTRALFVSSEALFFWLVAPLAALFLFGRG